MTPDHALMLKAARDGLVAGAMMIVGLAGVGWLVGRVLLWLDAMRSKRLKTLMGRIRKDA